MTYALWFLIGFAGAHKFYLEREWTGFGYLSLSLFGVFTRMWMFSGISEPDSGLTSLAFAFGWLGTIGLWALVVFLIWDAFTIPRQVAIANGEERSW